MSNKEIVAKCNALARRFYAMHGCHVEAGYRFDDAEHPHEMSMWNMAVAAFDSIADIDVESALAQFLEDGEVI
ncbi:MAG TPA: hypothetical protein VMG10_10765 [Gemmataceae bacterium]|nr:hypothetical protein [Gemmataceae bacterium]